MDEIGAGDQDPAGSGPGWAPQPWPGPEAGAPAQQPSPWVADPSFAGTSFAAPAPAGWVAPSGEILDSATAATWSVLPAADFEPPRRSRRRTAVVSGVAAFAVLVAAAGAYAWSALSGGGAQPAQVLPSTTVAFAEVDLNPSAGQKIALYQLLKKFPDSTGLRSTDTSFGDWLVRTLSQSAPGSPGVSGLDYTRDVKPWLGQRFAVAAVPSGRTAEPVVVVAETDQNAATAAMDKLRRNAAPQLGYSFMDGFLVVTPTSRTGADAVVGQARQAPLSANQQFTSDVAALGSDEVVTGWVNATRAGQLIGASLGALGAANPVGLGPMLGQSWRGRWVLGVHATSDSVELRMRTFDGQAQPSVPPVRIGRVAPGSFAVVAVSSPGKRVAQGWKQLESSASYGAMLSQTARLGLRLPGDLETLLGDNLTLSGGLDGGQPSLLAEAATADPTAAKAVLDRVLAAAVPGAPVSVADRVGPGAFYVGSSNRVIDGALSSDVAHQLTSTDLYSQAVADPGHAQFLVYVDLSRLWTAMTSAGGSLPSPEVQHLAAVGMTESASGGDSDTTVRVIFS